MVKNRAAIYARYSSHNQRSESIEIQLENSSAYCEEQGYEVVATYCDYAKTGRTTNRTEFQRMMEDAKLGLFDYVVIYKVTRIMRNRDEMSMARIMLRKVGVEIKYAGEAIAEGSSGVLQLGMLEVLAEWESAIDSERIRDGIQKNAKDCKANGHTLYGWDIVDGFYRVNEREAAVLRRMKNMLLSGSSVADIVRAVKSERTRNGKPFNHDKVTKLLRRVQNGGTYNYAGHTVEGGMPGLWPQAEQDMIGSILASRHKPHRKINSAETFPLSGKLWCAKCGRSMSGTSGTSATRARYSYYTCKRCRRTLRRELVEEAVVQMTLDALERPDVRDRIAACMTAPDEEEAREPESKIIEREIRQIDEAFSRIWKAIEDGIAPPGGKERVDDLKARKSELEARLRIAKADEEAQPTIDDVMAWLDEMARALEPTVIIGTFVRAVQLDREQLRLFFTFDHWGDGFRPQPVGDASKAEGELPPEEDSSPNTTLVEHAITLTNGEIQLDRCCVRVAHSWFVVIGTYRKTF